MGAYDTIDVRLSFGGWSLVLFGLLALFVGLFRVWLRLYRSFTFWVDALFVILPVLALLGLACGLIGLRRDSRRTMALVGVVLNVTTLLSVAAALVLSRVL